MFTIVDSFLSDCP